MPIPSVNGASGIPVFRDPSASRYGAADKYDFDNEAKWRTVVGVPVLDEHEMTNEAGHPVQFVDRGILEEIANNNNRRVRETGDPAPLIVGHTADSPTAPEKPVVGYAVNYRVGPFRNGRYAIHVDYKVRRNKEHVVEDFPRRSVELWFSKKEIDPIALLGGTTPERDLGVVVRRARMKAIALLGGTVPSQDLGITVRYDRKSGGTVLRYECEGATMPKPARYEMPPDDDDGSGDDGSFAPPPDDSDDDMDSGSDLGEPGDEGSSGGEEDPIVAKVLNSKTMKGLLAKVDEIFSIITGDEGGGEGGGMGGPGGSPNDALSDPGAGPPGGGMPPSGMDAPGGEPGMDAPGGAPPMGGGPPPAEDARRMHGDAPVQFEMGGTGFAGPSSTSIPTFGKKATPYSRATQMPRTTRTPASGSPDRVRLERVEKQNQHLLRKLARSEAEKIINQLENDERIIFADKVAEINFLALLDDSSRDTHVNEVYRKNYQRKAPDPTMPSHPGVARYARTDTTMPGSDADEFDPQTPAESMEYASALQKFKMDPVQATKYMRSRKGMTAPTMPTYRNGTRNS